MQEPLIALMYPYSQSEFFDHYADNTPLVVHHVGERIRALTELPFLASLDTLLASWPHKVDAYLPGIADEANSIAIPTDEALTHFHKGAGLLFNDINRICRLRTVARVAQVCAGSVLPDVCTQLGVCDTRGQGHRPAF